MNAQELNELCLKTINNWGMDDHKLSYLKLSREEKTTRAKELFSCTEYRPPVVKAMFNNYDFFRQIPIVFVQLLWDLKQAIMTCETNEDYERVIIRVKEIKKEKEVVPLVINLCKKLVETLKRHREFTTKERTQIMLSLLPSNSDSSVSDSSSTISRQNSG